MQRIGAEVGQRRLRHDRLAGLTPGGDAALEVQYFVAPVGQLLRRLLAAFATEAVERYGTPRVQLLLRVGQERAAVDVYQHGSFKVSFGVFRCRSHVDELHSALRKGLFEARNGQRLHFV